MTDKPLLCFHVEGNDDPEDSMLLFASSAIEAKRVWANEHGDGDRYIAGISARRCKHWDKFSPGPVPYLEMIEEGWWVQCRGCDIRIDRDSIGLPIGYDDDDWEMALEYGYDCSRGIMQPVEPFPQVIYCCQECRSTYEAERRRIKRMEAAARKWARAFVLKKWPGAELVERPGNLDWHVYATRANCGYLLIHDVSAAFKVPGMKHGTVSVRVQDEKWRNARERKPDPCDYRGYRDHPLPLSARKREVMIYVPGGDMDAWKAWLSENKIQDGVPA